VAAHGHGFLRRSLAGVLGHREMGFGSGGACTEEAGVRVLGGWRRDAPQVLARGRNGGWRVLARIRRRWRRAERGSGLAYEKELRGGVRVVESRRSRPWRWSAA